MSAASTPGKLEAFGSTSPFADPPWYNAINSPFYKPSHRKLRDYTRAYIDEYIIPNCEEWERQGFIPKEVVPSNESVLMKANERHAKMGFVAAGIFPPPVEYMSNIKLPADIPASGTSFLKENSIDNRVGCISRFHRHRRDCQMRLSRRKLGTFLRKRNRMSTNHQLWLRSSKAEISSIYIPWRKENVSRHN